MIFLWAFSPQVQTAYNAYKKVASQVYNYSINAV